ncbi:MAG: endopeptidase La [Deltaproteobacteria bacterium]|nr:endopeptidase La [Deltaproteobacteria bacterium]
MYQNVDKEVVEIPDVLPMLPVRDIVVFSYMFLPLFVGRESSIKAVEAAMEKDRLILLCTQKDPANDKPGPEDIYSVGTVAMVMKKLKLPDNRIKILVQGIAKARIKSYEQESPTFMVAIDRIEEPVPAEISVEVEALMRNVKEQCEKILSLKGLMSPEIMEVLENVNDPGRLADLVASNLRLNIEESQKVLEILDPVGRLTKVNEHLSKELELSTVQAKIQTQAKEEMSKTQREYFLREQLRAIKGELGDLDEKAQEVNEVSDKIKKAKMPTEAEKEARKQLTRLEQMHPDSAEASIVRTYLDWMVDLPWSKSTRDCLDIAKARKVLDEDHYDLEKVKERILEYLSVRKLKKKMKGPILCFAGPPGVGKTSLGKSIARALGRKFVRISLGGIRDEAEIRGHRRTYIGALPGRIIQGLKQAGTNNPIFMMDEIDKVGADFRGDPSAALLEVLDPEQNYAFSDHYLNINFDLSNVMFITTANMVEPIMSALKDRMEIIELSGYTDEEKLKIARQFIIPRQLEENGISDEYIKFSDEAILAVVHQYTAEAGLRNLEREIGTVCRKVARAVAEGSTSEQKITKSNINKYLGVPKRLPEEDREINEVGIATGLAWTQVGGELLYIEVILMKGKGHLVLTGSLGDVMKESAQAALSYIRARADQLGISLAFFEKHDIHIHVPAGAIPKDGPSAGITMATALVSAITRVPTSKDIAMTGEITLRGRVLPVGGLKEKALAALRHNITRVIIPERNRKDLDDMPETIRNKMEFVFVNTVDDVLDVALVKKVFKKASAARARKQAAPKRAVRPAARQARTRKRAD